MLLFRFLDITSTFSLSFQEDTDTDIDADVGGAVLTLSTDPALHLAEISGSLCRTFFDILL